jgi:hypothetical protein
MTTRSTFEDHLRAEHQAQFTNAELPTLIELCQKHQLNNSAARCPLCSEVIAKSESFYQHLGSHMEDIALLSLMPNLPCKFSTDVDVDLTPIEMIAPNVVEQVPNEHNQRRTNFHHTLPTPTSKGAGKPLEFAWSGTTAFEVKDMQSAPPTTNDTSHSNPSTVRNVPETTLDHENTSSKANEDDLTALFSSQPGFQSLDLSESDSNSPSTITYMVFFTDLPSAFKAAYKLNHHPISTSNSPPPIPDPNSPPPNSRLSIDLIQNTLKVHITSDGSPSDAPLLPSSIEAYTPTTSIATTTGSPASFKQYQTHEQTDQSWWSSANEASLNDDAGAR